MRIVTCPRCGHIAGPPRYPTDQYVPDGWECDYCELQALVEELEKAIRDLRKAYDVDDEMLYNRPNTDVVLTPTTIGVWTRVIL